MRVNERGYWEDMCESDIQEEHAFDQRLCEQIKSFFLGENARSGTNEVFAVVDLGCGLGNYTERLNTGNMICDGFDGNPDTPNLTGGRCKVLDLSKQHKFERQYDWVLSLEVGEHLPKEYEDTFIKNLCDSCVHGVVISWAIKGQGGMGHFNEQSNGYVINKLQSEGFEYDAVSSGMLRDNCSLWWFKNTLMVLRSARTRSVPHTPGGH